MAKAWLPASARNRTTQFVQSTPTLPRTAGFCFRMHQLETSTLNPVQPFCEWKAKILPSGCPGTTVQDHSGDMTRVSLGPVGKDRLRFSGEDRYMACCSGVGRVARRHNLAVKQSTSQAHTAPCRPGRLPAPTICQKGPYESMSGRFEVVLHMSAEQVNRLSHPDCCFLLLCCPRQGRTRVATSAAKRHAKKPNKHRFIWVLSLFQVFCDGTPGVTRTRDRRIRNPLLCPAELRGCGCERGQKNTACFA